MAKKKSEKIAQLAFVGSWCRTLSKCVGGSFGGELEQVVDKAIAKGDFRGLKMVSRDLGEWARSLPPSRQQEIDATLRTQFGIGLKEDAAEIIKEIGEIIERGKILDDDEYRLLEAYANAAYDDGSELKEMDKINELLAAYNTK